MIFPFECLRLINGIKQDAAFPHPGLLPGSDGNLLAFQESNPSFFDFSYAVTHFRMPLPTGKTPGKHRCTHPGGIHTKTPSKSQLKRCGAIACLNANPRFLPAGKNSLQQLQGCNACRFPEDRGQQVLDITGWRKHQRFAVQTIPETRRLRAIREHMAQMRITAFALNFGAHHSEDDVRLS
jgi:hypothetical protein